MPKSFQSQITSSLTKVVKDLFCVISQLCLGQEQVEDIVFLPSVHVVARSVLYDEAIPNNPHRGVVGIASS